MLQTLCAKNIDYFHFHSKSFEYDNFFIFKGLRIVQDPLSSVDILIDKNLLSRDSFNLFEQINSHEIEYPLIDLPLTKLK